MINNIVNEKAMAFPLDPVVQLTLLFHGILHSHSTYKLILAYMHVD